MSSVFVPRTVPPQLGEKWWSVENNRCLSIYNGTVLPNCFVGGTEFITSLGVITLKKGYDLSKKGVAFDVPTKDGDWHHATVKKYGPQRIFKVILSGSTYYCTANHRWFVLSGKRYRIVCTEDLSRYNRIPYRMCNTDDCTYVLGVEDTYRSEGVYCVVEPETKSFTLAGGEITGNCVGYAHGRFSEILGYFHPDLPVCNAGLWLETIQKSGTLKWGNVPKLGAVAVWKEPGQPGHVAIVEYINSDGSIMLSESGYGSSWNQRFWNSGPRISPNWYGSPYVFQGFIYNPGTEDVTYVAPYENGIRYGTNLSNVTTSYADVVKTFKRSVAASNSSQLRNTSVSVVGSVSTSSTATAALTSSVASTSSITPNGSSVKVVEKSSTPISAQKLINAILVHAGSSNDGYTWVKSRTKFNSSGWSAAMICAASIDADTSDIVPTDVFSYSALGSTIVNSMNGEYVSGPKRGGVESPQIGDIFAVCTSSSSNKYAATQIGIVTDIHDSTIQTLESDSGTKIVIQTRRTSDISWYVRPNWLRVSKSQVSEYNLTSTSVTRLPSELTDSTPMVDYLGYQSKEDATLREVTYLTDQAEPSISLTGVKLSAINYSGLLDKVYDVMGLSNVQHDQASDIKSSNFNNSYFKSSAVELQGVPQIIFEYMYNKGLSTSKVIGFLANIQAQSHFQTNFVDLNSGASGIMRWSGDRKTSMIRYCGSDWKNSLTSQLEFLWNELQTSEAQTITALSSIQGNTQVCSESAAEIICKQYVRPSNLSSVLDSTRLFARTLWTMLSSVYTSNISTSSNVITTSDGNSKVKGKTIEVPSSLYSRRITASYMPYPQSKPTSLKNIWLQGNRSSKYYIAIQDDYFLVSMSSKFGSENDIISVILDDGTYFNAIIALTEGSSYYVDENSKSIIRWMTSGNDVSSLTAGLKQAGWDSRSIVNVVNYGSWIS